MNGSCVPHGLWKAVILLLPGSERNGVNDDRRFDGRIEKAHFRHFECDSIFILEKDVDEELFLGPDRKPTPIFMFLRRSGVSREARRTVLPPVGTFGGIFGEMFKGTFGGTFGAAPCGGG
jgi:hypothetical protein